MDSKLNLTTEIPLIQRFKYLNASPSITYLLYTVTFKALEYTVEDNSVKKG